MTYNDYRKVDIVDKKNTFTKRKSLIKEAEEESLTELCEKLACINPGLITGYSKKFILDDNSCIKEEIKGENLIYLYSPTKKIIMPSGYRQIEDRIIYSYEDVIIAWVVYIKMKLEDGIKAKDYTLYLDNDRIEREKKYVYTKLDWVFKTPHVLWCFF